MKLPLLIGDERRMKQILINLVRNALKFTNSGTIKVKASYNPIMQHLVLHVEDSGVGIP